MVAPALPSIPLALKIQAMSAPPTNTLNIVFQLAIPVHKRITAPIAMAITLVSPIEPGIKPITWSQEKAGTVPVAASPKGVAIVNVSGKSFPKPQMLSLATQQASPLIAVG